MSEGYLIKQATLINEGKEYVADLRIKSNRIEQISSNLTPLPNETIIDAEGLYLIPGAIDDQVHFREPGLTHKANIATESAAAVAGGITSFMEMPNTVPNALTQALLQDKYDIAAETSVANYSFFMGASNENIEEVLKTNHQTVCGVKIFMGSSTGNMLVDSEQTLTDLFSKVPPMLIATHCEDEATIKRNLAEAVAKFGDQIPVEMHPIIRDEEACYASSSLAVRLAKKFNTKLHILHISTAKELSLFDHSKPLSEKMITAEACVHHLWFSEEDYAEKGNFIKWNPAVKKASDRDAIWEAVNNGRIDVIATDHAPHTIEEKNQVYSKAPSGGPLVQHMLIALFEKAKEGKISLPKIVEKTAHNPAILFNIKDRGYLREGYFADLVLVDPKKPLAVNKNNIMYKCGWSPFEGFTFSHSIAKTFVNGVLAYDANQGITTHQKGMRLLFDRL